MKLGVRLGRHASMDELCGMLDALKTCPFCKHVILEDVAGKPCACCGKMLIDRELRDSTIEQVIDYAGMDPSSEVEIAEHVWYPSPDPDYDPSERDFVTPQSKRMCTKKDCTGALCRGKHITVRNEEGHPRFAGAVPKLNLVTPAEKASVLNGIKHGEDVDSVCEEFRARLVALGYKDGKRNDGVTFKYPSFLRMLFSKGVFATRSSLFDQGAPERAHAAFKKIARDKYRGRVGISNRKEKHFFTSLCHGYDDFVRLSPAPEPEPAQMTEEEMFSLLA